jgi:hypothetical protein
MYIGEKKISIGTAIVERVKGIVYDYIETATYERGEIVYYEGNIYTPIVERVQGVVPTDTASWKPLASGGGGGGGSSVNVVRLI